MPENQAIYLAALDGSPRKRLVVRSKAAHTPLTAGSEYGHLLFLRDGTLMAQALNTRRFELAGEPGTTMRVFNGLYPDEVAAMVLGDAWHEDEIARLPRRKGPDPPDFRRPALGSMTPAFNAIGPLKAASATNPQPTAAGTDMTKVRCDNVCYGNYSSVFRAGGLYLGGPGPMQKVI